MFHKSQHKQPSMPQTLAEANRRDILRITQQIHYIEYLIAKKRYQSKENSK